MARNKNVAPTAVPASEGAPAKPPRSRSRTATIAILATVGTAAVGALAGAIITPARIEAMFGWVQPTAAPSIEYKTATDRTDSISLKVPEDWAVGLARYDPGFEESTEEGVAVLAGTQVTGSAVYGESTAYVAASTVSTERLGLVGASEDALRRWLREEIVIADWTIESCVLSEENSHAIEGWLSESRLWHDCGSLEGLRLLEWLAVTPDGEVVQWAR